MSTFWEGTGGALIGAAASTVVAVWAILRTRRDERELMREQMSLTAAHEVLRFAHEVRRRLDPFIHAHRPDARIDWDAVSQFAATAEAHGERFLAFRSVIRPMRIADHLDWLWDELISVRDRLTPEAITQRDRVVLDQVARNIGQGLTNLMDDVDLYLRADLERREVARQPLSRRYRLTKGPPFVRRTRLHEVIKMDEHRIPKADY